MLSSVLFGWERCEFIGVVTVSLLVHSWTTLLIVCCFTYQDINTYRNPQRVLECLQRGLKIADACTMSSSSNVLLFVEILDYYVYYYEIENPVITDKFVSGLIALINEHFDSIGMSGSSTMLETRAYYGQIINQIKRKQTEDGKNKERFGLIVC